MNGASLWLDACAGTWIAAPAQMAATHTRSATPPAVFDVFFCNMIPPLLLGQG
jgi:hypothetical protein